MSYVIGGVEKETDDYGFLMEPDFSDEAVKVIAAAEGIELTDNHMAIISYFRDKYREEGHTPNFRNFMKDMADILPSVDSKQMYDLFPHDGPAKQAVKIAGLPKPYGKGGY
jgi:TusE/DsrC/DsvC family sulfur relay protein